MKVNRAIDVDAALGNPALRGWLVQRITASPQQRITFADYMEQVLYHPLYGYYSTRALQLGFRGDFVTAPHLAPDFGELLAEQFAEMWLVLGHPNPFTLLEMGAGRGRLAKQILSYLIEHYPDLVRALNYTIVERSPALIAEQQHHLQPFLSANSSDQGPIVRWCDWADLPADSLVGCCFSNELVDAFPVHLVTIVAGQLQEIYVALAEKDGETLVETIADLSTPQLADYFRDLNLDLSNSVYATGYRTEVNLAALDWLKIVADRLHRGYLLTIDYGYPAHRYYSPTRRGGTLQCYYQQAHHNDPYCYLGEQDVTAHVNFTALEQWGQANGLERLGFIEQGLFLMALGLGDRLANLSTAQATDPESIQTLLKRRDALHSLVTPLGLGNFGVLLQGKCLSPEQKNYPLKGFQVPSMGNA